MEITEMKDAVTERAVGYAESLLDTLRDIADSLSAPAKDLMEDASDALPGRREVPYRQLGLWFGLGVALVGGALYAWRTYGNRISDHTEEFQREPSSEQKSEARPQSRSASSVRTKAHTAGHPGKSQGSKKTQARAAR